MFISHCNCTISPVQKASWPSYDTTSTFLLATDNKGEGGITGFGPGTAEYVFVRSGLALIVMLNII